MPSWVRIFGAPLAADAAGSSFASIPTGTFAIPKSSTFTKSGSPSFVTSITFSGLRSRWTIPSPCPRETALAIWLVMWSARPSSIAPFPSASRSECPSTYSSTRKNEPSSSIPKSVAAAMFG